ncbi:multidrug transporter subunit MdtN [Pusillimonas sp. CC-YST705]|uniref:Multidrug transporter subunit MdtN n=1 Tax=Mesopusillimonas faecipullorum TaxID=2755040 RepID=A0ABS8C824_9BURK|nr:multidrug transporter subunit MdtN [Mesopusillimonas faecipullorum]MCB5362182.1 multidrug transporter subunit MdtN [Mesopusillimonas faecipullorum]
MNTPAQHSSIKPLAILVALLVIAAAIVLGTLYLLRAAKNPSSEDAVISANVVHISSSLPGHIESMEVTDGQFVHKDDLLFTVDPAFYQLRYEQAQAELALAEATYAAKERAIRAETHNASIAQEQINRARTNLAMATQTQQRLANLATKGYVAKQQLDEATTLKRDAQISLNQALEQAGAAQALVGTSDAELAMVQISQAGLAMAKRNLELTQIKAPHNGLIAGLHTASGEHLLPGASVFTLIDTDSWHATGMYLETDLKRISIGDCATVYVLADPSRALTGKVDTIGWGVSSTGEVNLPFNLPYVQKSLNWVRVAQRFPVRIRLAEPPPDLMRVGASATIVIHSNDDC